MQICKEVGIPSSCFNLPSMSSSCFQGSFARGFRARYKGFVMHMVVTEIRAQTAGQL